jgi:hypothetical protein
MSGNEQGAAKGSHRIIEGIAESSAAIDEVIALARITIRIFDATLAHRGFNSQARFEVLRHFLHAGRHHALRIVLHDTDTFDRDAARLMVLMQQFPTQVVVHRTLPPARHAEDPMVIADDQSIWHRLNFEQPRAVVALHSPADVAPLLQRFEEIWDHSELAISPTVLGL